MAHRVFVTGGSGFVGSTVIAQLLAGGAAVHAILGRRPIPPRDGLTTFAGGLFDPAAMAAVAGGCDAAVHLVGIIRERPADDATFDRIHVDGTRAALAAAKSAGIRRFVHLSACGSRPDADASQYHRTKFAAEQLVRASGLDFTIFRPSLIHGPGSELMAMEAGWARGRRFPFAFMPYFAKGVAGFGGPGRVQPVFVQDVARAVADATDNPETIGHTFDLVGPEVYTWPDVHWLVAQTLLNHRRPALPIPGWWGKLLARTLPAPLLPFTKDQVTMAVEDNLGDAYTFADAFGWKCRPFAATLAGYAKQL